MWIRKIHIFSHIFWKKIENRCDFFEKSAFSGFWPPPHYDVIGGQKSWKILKSLSQTYFWPFCQVSLKSERFFWKIVIFGLFGPPLWRHRPKFENDDVSRENGLGEWSINRWWAKVIIKYFNDIFWSPRGRPRPQNGQHFALASSRRTPHQRTGPHISGPDPTLGVEAVLSAMDNLWIIKR